MKKTLFLIAFVVSAFSLNAQDILVRKGGEIENVKVLEVSPTEVRFKKSNNPDGPVFVEKCSNIYSIKYQNGEVQTFKGKEKDKKSLCSFPSAYTNTPKYTHEVELHFGDGWGVGYQFRKDFNRYVGWDIVGVSYMTRFKSPAEVGLINFRPIGIRLYSPAYESFRAYAGLKLGYSLVYERVQYYEIYRMNSWDISELISSDNKLLIYSYNTAHFFGLDFCTGIQIHKNIAIGYNLNFIANGNGSLLNHMGKISFLF